MKKDIIISIGFGLLFLSMINAFLGVIKSPLLQSVNVDFIMTSLSIYVLFITISQILYKEASQGKRELEKENDYDLKEKKEKSINRQTKNAKFVLLSSVVLTILSMIILINAPIEDIKMVSNTSTLFTMSFFFFFIGFYESD